MVNHFVQEFIYKISKDLTTKRALSKLRTACEQAKCKLSSSPQARIEIDCLDEGINFYTSINRQTFEDLNAGLLYSTMSAVEDCLQQSKMDKAQIDDVILVGRTTQIPMVQKMLRDFFNGKELMESIYGDEAVAYGAAVQAAILDGNVSDFQDLFLLDVNPLPLSTCLIGGLMFSIIERNTAIPTKQTLTYKINNGRENVSFWVYELEPVIKKNRTRLRKFNLTGIPPVLTGLRQIEMTFNIDTNGILSVTAVEKSTAKENMITVTTNTGRLSKEEIDRMVNDAEKYRAEDEKQKEMNYMQYVLQSYCFNMMRSVKDEKLKDKISVADKNTILDKCNEVIRWLEEKHAEKEEFESQQKELESVCDPIMKKMDSCAGQSLLTAEQGRTVIYNECP
jgi:L1 cell adhesion molecule like protein